MARRVLEVELAGVGSIVRGPGARELVILVARGNRAPVWSHVRRGWSVQEHTARDVIAAAEVRNYDVVIAGRRGAALLEDGRDRVPVSIVHHEDDGLVVDHKDIEKPLW